MPLVLALDLRSLGENPDTLDVGGGKGKSISPRGLQSYLPATGSWHPRVGTLPSWTDQGDLVLPELPMGVRKHFKYLEETPNLVQIRVLSKGGDTPPPGAPLGGTLRFFVRRSPVIEDSLLIRPYIQDVLQRLDKKSGVVLVTWWGRPVDKDLMAMVPCQLGFTYWQGKPDGRYTLLPKEWYR